MIRLLSRTLGCALLVLFGWIHMASAQTVDAVEPENWWVGMEWNEVQLMVYGDDLSEVSATVPESGVEVTEVKTLPNDSYAFVTIRIADDALAQTYTLTLQHANTEVTVDYPVKERADTEGRHQGFDADDVVYLITPDRFADSESVPYETDDTLDEYDPDDVGMRHGGDLPGLIERLDYLEDLGVTTLWLNPVLENRGIDSYHGYKATDLYRIDPRFGTNDDYRTLVSEAHARDMKVIYDHVSNHIGLRHPWMDNLPRDSWVHGSEDDHVLDAHYMMSISDPYADPQTEELLRTFWFVETMPDLDQRDPLVATYLIQNSIWWIETTGLDGIREDTYPYAYQEFLADWAEAIKTEYPDFSLVGEIWNNNPAFLAQFQTGSPLQTDFETNMSSVMDFALSEAMRDYLAGTGGLGEIYEVIAQDFVYDDPTRLMTFIDNHDMTRGIFEAEGDTQKVKQMLTLLLTTRGIPQLLYGTEINMVGGESHVELREPFPGGFPWHTRDAFTEEGRTDEEQAVFQFLRDLLHLRQDTPALRRGELTHYQPTYFVDVYRYLRTHNDETVLVLINGHDEAHQAPLDDMFDDPESLRLTDMMTDEEVPVVEGEDGPAIDLEARGAYVLEVQP